MDWGIKEESTGEREWLMGIIVSKLVAFTNNLMTKESISSHVIYRKQLLRSPSAADYRVEFLQPIESFSKTRLQKILKIFWVENHP